MTYPSRPSPVWGPSVAHSSSCNKRVDDSLSCNCPKKNYCEGCDAQHHFKQNCPRTVLDDMVEAMTFSDKSLKRLINEILDSAEARRTVFYSMENHIRSRIDELAERHGNLGLTRKRLRNLASKELARRYRRGYRRG